MTNRVHVVSLAHRVFGTQYAIVDERDRHLVVRPRLVADHGIRWLVDRCEGGAARLATVIAETRVERPSADHVYVRHRNDSPCDMRAANLYWCTARELRQSTRGAVRSKARRSPTTRRSEAV